eukprot:TRINITY_DN21443_c0_g1_i1.p1 TRINITY_DN21443_c0_g1~~TRINITY_DN21443_c0_g1_i1.p1  ORF type:complete len:176 (+),score=52.13 TRINITY_DN21443_c0_g1_i1:59-529(+)
MTRFVSLVVLLFLAPAATAQNDDVVKALYDQQHSYFNDLKLLLTQFPALFGETGTWSPIKGVNQFTGNASIASFTQSFTTNVTAVKASFQPLQVAASYGSYAYQKDFFCANGWIMTFRGFSAFLVDVETKLLIQVDDFVDLAAGGAAMANCFAAPK